MTEVLQSKSQVNKHLPDKVCNEDAEDEEDVGGDGEEADQQEAAAPEDLGPGDQVPDEVLGVRLQQRVVARPVLQPQRGRAQRRHHRDHDIRAREPRPETSFVLKIKWQCWSERFRQVSSKNTLKDGRRTFPVTGSYLKILFICIYNPDSTNNLRSTMWTVVLGGGGLHYYHIAPLSNLDIVGRKFKLDLSHSIQHRKKCLIG